MCAKTEMRVPQVTRDKLTAAEASAQSHKEDNHTLQQKLKQSDMELDDLRRLHTSKVASLQSEVAEEHRQFCDAQRRLEALHAQAQSRDAAASAAAATAAQNVQERDEQVCSVHSGVDARRKA